MSYAEIFIEAWPRRKSEFIHTTSVHDALSYSEVCFPAVTL